MNTLTPESKTAPRTKPVATDPAARMDPEKLALDMATRAVVARAALAPFSDIRRSIGLRAIADAIQAHQAAILAANDRDIANARASGRPAAFIDRLQLDESRLNAIIQAVRDVAGQDDPLGETIENWQAHSGVDIRQVRVPIGVLAVIYESRPNVTADAAALALRSGNAVILRGGSDSQHSSLALVEAIRAGLGEAGLPVDLVQHPVTTDRAFVGAVLTGLNGQIDLVIPRGGRDLVARVQADARVAVLGHLDGVCHAYVDKTVDADMARALILNAKMRRTGVCNALECLIIHADHLETLWPLIAADLEAAGCRLRGDARAEAHWPTVTSAADSDWGREFLDSIIAVKTVDSIEQAIDHIAQYGSGHTDMIVTANDQAAEQFLNAVDSAVVIVNATTGLSDGAEFGFGAEIGIATSRLHARGPVGARQLTTYKYQVRGTGQVRD